MTISYRDINHTLN